MRQRAGSIVGRMVLAGAALLALGAPAAAQVDFGVRGGLYLDAEEPFLGAELLFPLPFGPRNTLFFNPNVEVVFVDDSLATLNLDVHYDLPIDGPGYLWVGAGPAILFEDPPGRRRDRETDFGANLFAGYGWRTGFGVPYLQAKLIVSDDNEGVLAAGIRF